MAGEVPRYAYSGKPFSIYGVSPDSQGQAYYSNAEKAKKLSEQFFCNVISRPMHGELASQPYSPLITLMTADYLLTARDLPGWPGKFPPINYRQVLRNGLNELANGLYGEERICRELAILDKIAEAHGLREYFRTRARRACQKRKRSFFAGSGVNANAILLDGAAYNLHNVFDAAYAAQHLHQAYVDLQPAPLAAMISRSLMYRIRVMGKGHPFPPESEWRAG